MIVLSPDNVPGDTCSVSYQVLDDPYYSLLVDEDLVSYLSSSRKLHLKVVFVVAVDIETTEGGKPRANSADSATLYEGTVIVSLLYSLPRRVFVFDGLCTLQDVSQLPEAMYSLLFKSKSVFLLSLMNITQIVSESASFEEFSDVSTCFIVHFRVC